MAKIIEFGKQPRGPDDPPHESNRDIFARIEALSPAGTPESRLLNELRGMEETLLANHRQYARLWEEADRLGIHPPVRTAKQIVADADPMFRPGTPSLPPALGIATDSEAQTPMSAQPSRSPETSLCGPSPNRNASRPEPEGPGYPTILDEAAGRARPELPDASRGPER